jgi:DNA repair exonuclease SbcCD ATPase subunit
MWVTGGFLDGQQFQFNDNVTCLIGDTGSGKSVCLELIRFCLNQTATVPKIKQEIDSLIGQQLGSLGTVHILLRKDASYYLVERTWGAPPTPPSISRILNSKIEKIDEEIDIKLFFHIKAFSQSEIIEFAREPTVRWSPKFRQVVKSGFCS